MDDTFMIAQAWHLLIAAITNGREEFATKLFSVNYFFKNSLPHYGNRKV